MKLTSKTIDYTVSIVDDLPTTGVVENQTIVVADEDRGGVFIARDSGEPNDGTIFDGGSLNWHRQYYEAVNIKWFGAVGDGIVDDTVVVQKVIDSFNDIYIPDGIYMVNTLTLHSNLSIKGEGTLKLISDTTSFKYLIGMNEAVISEYSNIHISGITLDGNRNNMPSATLQDVKRFGIKIAYVENLTIDNVTVKSFGSSDDKAMYSPYYNNSIGISLLECNNYNIKNCKVSDNAHYGIQLWICSNGYITNNTVFNNGAHSIGGAAIVNTVFDSNILYYLTDTKYTYSITAGLAEGLWLRNVSDIVISNNSIKKYYSLTINEGASIQLGKETNLATSPKTDRMKVIISNPTALVNSGSVITGNYVSAGNQFGIYTWAGNNELSVIDGNTVKEAVECGIITTSNRASIKNNTIVNKCSDKAIKVEGRDSLVSDNHIYNVESTAISVQGVRNIISNNKIEDFCLSASGKAIETFEYSDNYIITGNHIYSSNVVNIQQGIFIANNTNKCIISNNFVDDSITDGIYGEIDNSDFKPTIRMLNNIANTNYIRINKAYKYKLASEITDGYSLWVDSTGDVRVKSDYAYSDTDGTIVGTQS